ncbi:TetR family transcriptional regulator [Nocardia sp. NPDC047648]|uniref:TetR/AcrR family transcriptional regulator n=1 Tax=Nocardia sp. NPDC047648 TaxID=3155625 RepID=UPI00340E0FFA
MARLKSEERRRRLVDAAFAVMARDGVAAATTRAICAEAGMAQSAFHYAFRSKEELLQELTESVVQSQTAVLEGLEISSDSLRTAVSTAMERMLSAGMNDPGRQAVLYELTVQDIRSTTNPGELGRWQYRLYTDIAAMFLRLGSERFDVQWRVPEQALARMVAITLDGTLFAWLADRDTAAATASVQALAEAVVSLAVPRTDDADRQQPPVEHAGAPQFSAIDTTTPLGTP